MNRWVWRHEAEAEQPEDVTPGLDRADDGMERKGAGLDCSLGEEEGVSKLSVGFDEPDYARVGDNEGV